jgi:hypothetical protein
MIGSIEGGLFMSEKKTINAFRKVTLRRDFFTKLTDGSDEFDWVLSELGIEEEDRGNIEEIELDVGEASYTPEEY